MTPEVTLDDALLALAYLLNQTVVPTAEKTRWVFYITSGIERLYRAFDFDMAKITVELTSDADGLIDLSDYELGIVPAIEQVGDGTPGNEYTYVSSAEYGQYAQGDRRWNIQRNEDNEWQIKTTEPSATVNVTLYEAPTISADQVIPFTRMLIAKAGLIYYRQAQDPEADTAPEEDQLKQEVGEVIERQNRTRPQRFARSTRDVGGGYIGAK